MQSVERAADVLLALAIEPEPPTLRALSLRLGISASTCLRLLTALEKKGLVERDAASRRFGVGVRALALANGRSRYTDLQAIALPEMRRLRDTSGETVSLHVRSGDQHVCIAEVESHQEVRRRVEVGRVLPVALGATGRVLRAYGPESGSGEPASMDGLPRSQAEVRQTGYAASVEERESGVSAVSAPIFGADGGMRAALTVSGPAVRFQPAQMRIQALPLRAAAQRISARLGFDGLRDPSIRNPSEDPATVLRRGHPA